MEHYTNKEYLKMIGERIKLYRVYAGISQKELEEKTGISRRTFSRLESGSSIQLDSLIKILSALNLDENLKVLIPDQSKRPSMYLEKTKTKQRVSSKTKRIETFKWGDED